MDSCERLQQAIDSGLWNLVTGQSDTWTLDLLEDALVEIQTCRSVHAMYEKSIKSRDETLNSLLDQSKQQRAEIERLESLNKRAMAIITDAIMHGMPVTDEVAAVRNEIVCGPEARRK